MKVKNILLVGVGGQGVVLAAELLALAAIEAGYDVKQTEVHGVAQRGGAVSSHVRIGQRVFSPLTKPGEVDILLALEKLEALRYAHQLKDNGIAIVNDHEIDPIRFPGDERPYPQEAIDFLKGKGLRVIPVAATAQAIELGNRRVANVILLGVLSQFLEIPSDAGARIIPQGNWDRTLEGRIPQRFLTLNRRAFARGRELTEEARAHA